MKLLSAFAPIVVNNWGTLPDATAQELSHGAFAFVE